MALCRLQGDCDHDHGKAGTDDAWVFWLNGLLYLFSPFQQYGATHVNVKIHAEML
jgi:hypothetical protein